MSSLTHHPHPSLVLACVAALLPLGCYRPRVGDKETIALHHPAGGSLEGNAVYGQDTETQREWFSLTKVTNDEVCVDAGIVVIGPNKETAVAAVAKSVDAQAAMLFFRDSGARKRVEVSERMAPAVIDERRGSWTGSRLVETGDRETVCVEDLVNDYGNVIGCARYVERAQTKSVSVDETGTLYTAMGGRRWCIENDGYIRPESELFDINYDHLPHRFVLQGGAPKAGAWGASGGTPAVGDAAIRAIIAGRDATAPNRPPPPPRSPRSPRPPRSPSPPRAPAARPR